LETTANSNAPTVPSGSRFGLVQVGLIVAILAALGVAGYFAYTRLMAPAPVQTPSGIQVKASVGNIVATVSATGPVVANRISRLTMGISGRVEEIQISLGQSVPAGAPLVRLEPSTYQVKERQALSNLKTAQLKLDQLKNSGKDQEVLAAEASARSAEARLRDLQGGALPEDLASAQSSVNGTAASVTQAEIALAELRRGPTAAELASAEQSVASARSALKRAENDLATVRAGATADELYAAQVAIDQARNSLYSAQISRDATCGRGAGSACDSANASLLNNELAVAQAVQRLAVLRAKPEAKDLQAARTAYDAAAESLRSAEVRLADLRAGATPERIRQAEASLAGARASQQAAIARLDTLKSGAKSADLQAAIASLATAQANLAVRRAGQSVDLALAEEAVKSAQYVVDQAQLDLKNTVLSAPFAGMVTAVTLNVGEQAGTGTPVLTLVDPRSVRVDVSIDETDIGRIAPGQQATVTFDSLAGRTYQGRILGVSPLATTQQGVSIYLASIDIDNADGALRPGMTANAAIVVTQRNNVVTVPNRAIQRQGRNQFVTVINGSQPERRQVRVGVANEQASEILEGVADGETVLIPATTSAAPKVGGAGIPGVGGPPSGGPPSGGPPSGGPPSGGTFVVKGG